MILQALNEYYLRKMSEPDPRNRLPVSGLEYKEIPFILDLSLDGKLLGIKDTRRIEGKRKVAERFLVPQTVKRTVAIAPNLLWDTVEYVLGFDSKGKADRVRQQAQAFRDRLDSLPHSVTQDAGVKAVMCFLSGEPLASVAATEHYEEMCSTNAVVTFRLSGDIDLVCQRPAVIETLHTAQATIQRTDAQMCLVTGSMAPPEALHPAIKGVWGAQTAGANIVSFNLDAFKSFGKDQGSNAPIGKAAVFAYTTALNHLLQKGSRQRIQVGDASTVFWAQSTDEFESTFGSIFGRPDDPDDTEDLRALLQSIQSGKFDGGRGDNRFHVLGLSPNAARISVRFWRAEPLRDIAHRIRDWFTDVAIVHAPFEPEFPSMFRLLTACAAQGKADNIPPNLGGEIMHAILSGSPYPMSWLSAAIRRNRAEQNVTYLRAAAIKACLNRLHQYTGRSHETQPMLDPNNPNPAYRLGRLFATLEKTQEDASDGELNATIRDRYYGAASSTPVAVFTTLLRLKNHHIGKLRTQRRSHAIYLEKLVGEIMNGIADFPKHLTLPDQGRFALGYYHQRQAFFAKPE